MAFNEKKMSAFLDSDGIQIWVNSFGGSMTKYILSWISANGKRVDSANYYKKGCHYLRPVPTPFIKMGLYCYTTDLGIAMTSQMNKGYYKLNYSRIKSCDDKRTFSIENWINVVEQQINEWTTGKPPFPILILNTDKIWDYETTVRKFLKLSNHTQLEPKRERSTRMVHPDLEPFKARLDEINSRLRQLPEIAILYPDGHIEHLDM
jgi:hypothetical protein